MTAARKRAAPREPKTRPSNDNAVAAGKSRAARSGLRGESVVEAFNKVAADRRVALLQKVPTAVRWTPKGLMYTHRSTVDFVGVMLDGTGRHVAIEVKTCSSKKRFQIAETENHQRAYLDAVDAAGGVAVLVVVFGKESPVVCQLPWRDVRDLVSLSDVELCASAVGGTDYLTRFARTAPAREVTYLFNDGIEPAMFAAMLGRTVSVR